MLRPKQSVEMRDVVARDGVCLHTRMESPPVEALSHEDRPLLVFCHGYSLDGRSWSFQRAALVSRGYRVLTWDHRGHGTSGKGSSSNYTIDQLGSDLASVLDQAAPDGPLALIGHSMGGMAIMALADSHPHVVAERVVAVAFVSTSGGDMDKVDWGLGARLGRFVNSSGPRIATAAAPVQSVVKSAWDRMPWVGNTLVAASSFGSKVPRPTAQLTQRMIVETDLTVISDFAPTFADHDKTEALHAFANIPGLVLVGDRDVLTPPERSAALAEHLPLTEHVVVSRGGHNIMMEHPELVTDHLLSLLKRAAQPSYAPVGRVRVKSIDIRPGRGRFALTLGSPQ